MSEIGRREAIARLAAITGAVMIGAEFFVTGCARPGKAKRTAFTPADIALLDEIGDTIIPTTDTPGAKAAGIGAFMAMMVNDCYDDDTHVAFEHGLRAVDDAARKANGKSFVESTPAQRTSVLDALDREARDYAHEHGRGDTPHYFRLMKELTVLGYFSSEIGCTKALRYVEAPGAYHGDVAYHTGDRGWFNPSRRLS